ncbi:lipocalin-like domain-containing protein [Bacteroides fragilis]|nr:lipocalin-like domain-containing protein [Bacteroides fragilis]UVP35953.1 lipocalin-like domain-containing protein [Bacteroides fragilis]UVR31769.1 lipocalin-like domain-containing protein [Bacteroides fragilis]UVS02195.1 lipocalin-like domain-containing protein [Bacteroides fragilis]
MARVQDFAVEKLNSNKLVLQSDYARLEFRKY